MNLQTEINKLRFAVESLMREIEAQNFKIGSMEARIGKKPDPFPKIELTALQTGNPTHGEVVNLADAVKELTTAVKINSIRIEEVKSCLPKPAQKPVYKKRDKVIYSAMFGDYDNWVEPEFENDWDHILFTDQPIVSDRYQVVYMDRTEKLERKIKIAPHLFEELKDYKVWCWCDASIKPKKNLDVYLERYDQDMIFLQHPSHKCTYFEAKACIQAHKDKPEIIEAQMNYYRGLGFPENQGMVASGMHLKRNTPEVISFMNQWLAEVMGFSRRDQLSFNYVKWKTGQQVALMPWSTLYKDFQFMGHKRRKHA